MSNADKISAALELARQQLNADFPEPIPVPTPTPTPTPTPVPPLPGGASILVQNMTEGPNGTYSSTGLASSLKCYVQFRTSKPASYVKLTCRRRTNVIWVPGMNLKEFRTWPDGTYPDDYLGRGLSDGAWKFTTETPTSNVGWFSYTRKADAWTTESYELDYANQKATIKIGDVTWSATGWNTGDANRTQFGVQCVIASDPRPVGVPSTAYTQFDSLSFVWR